MSENERLNGLEEAVKQFVAEQLSASPEYLLPSTRLGHDLRVDGDDAAEFLQAFAERFGVDLSEFDFDKHFGPELPFNPFLYLYWRLFDSKQLQFVPVTIADLVEAAERKRWQARN